MMAGMTGAFGEALDRKYNILGQQADAETTLKNAQAQDITASTASNSALKQAQARGQNAAADTVRPLTDASIAATQSQIGLQGQQGQLYGQQGDLLGAQTKGLNEGFNPADLGVLGNYHTQVNGNHLSAGTSNVKGPTMAAPLPPPGVASVQPMGTPMVTPLLDHMHGIVHHAMSALHTAMSAPNVAHYAGGGSVPGPGQTQGGGSWEGPQPTTGTPSGTPASPTQNQDLRAKMFPVKAAGGVPSVPGPGQTLGGGSWEGPQPTTGTSSLPAPSTTPNQDLRAKMGYGVKAADGLSKVPGKGNPGVDKVPAVLAPGEAVLNQGAATHMGRGAIAALNALGAHAMSQAGTPPMVSPPGGGAPQPEGGPPMAKSKPPASKPTQGKTVAPMARGMPKGPPSKGKGPPPKMMAGKK